jgi:hypothetical protein
MMERGISTGIPWICYVGEIPSGPSSIFLVGICTKDSTQDSFFQLKKDNS